MVRRLSSRAKWNQVSDWCYWKWLEDCLCAVFFCFCFFFTAWCCLSEKDAHLCVLRVDDERGGNTFNLPRRHPRRSRKQDAPAVWPADSRRLRSAFVKSSLSPCSYTHRAPPECASAAGLRRGGSKHVKSLFKCLISHRLVLIAREGSNKADIVFHRTELPLWSWTESWRCQKMRCHNVKWKTCQRSCDCRISNKIQKTDCVIKISRNCHVSVHAVQVGLISTLKLCHLTCVTMWQWLHRLF